MINLNKFKKFLAGPKIIFVILGIILVIEIIYAVSVLSTPTPAPPLPVIETSTSSEKTPGRISLISAEKTLKVGNTLSVSVNIDTGGHFVDGVDLIVRFDPKVMEATPGGLAKGTILDEYPLLSLDERKGAISISGISSLKKGYRGSGEFATLIFKAKARGRTNIVVDFKKGSTTDSNLVENTASKDILDTVDNLELNIN